MKQETRVYRKLNHNNGERKFQEWGKTQVGTVGLYFDHIVYD